MKKLRLITRWWCKRFHRKHWEDTGGGHRRCYKCGRAWHKTWGKRSPN